MKPTFRSTYTIFEPPSRIQCHPHNGATINLERLNARIASNFPGASTQHKSDPKLMNTFITGFSTIMAEHFPWDKFYHLDDNYPGPHSSRGFRIHLKLVHYTMFNKDEPP